jgi:hypothetical protein
MVQGFGGEMGSLLKQAQEMQRRIRETEASLAGRTVEGSAGGGAVLVVVNGMQEVQSVKIDRAVVDPDDMDGLEDLVTVAVRQAMTAARQLREREMSKITGGMNLPGMGF